MTARTGPAAPCPDLRDVEQAVERLARVVLHTTTLADRMLALRGQDPTGDRAARLDLLLDVAARGRQALLLLATQDPALAPRGT